MRIAMLAGHACIRVQKMAIPLISGGHTVHIASKKIPSYWQGYATFTMCNDYENMANAIRLLDPHVDLFHAHNEPSWFVTCVKENSRKPVILDVHDTYLTRLTQEYCDGEADKGNFTPRVFVEERNNFQLADGLNFVTEHVRDEVMDEFKVKCPTFVLPSYVPKQFYQYHGREWLGGLTYEGKVVTPDECKGIYQGFTYCDYTQLADDCQKIGMDFHVYPGKTRPDLFKHYKDKDRVYFHKPFPFDQLLPHVTRHDWGLVGNAYHTPQWEKTSPNKLFEYLASGVPVVGMNAKWCEEFIKEHDIGIVVGSIQELAERWSEHTEKRKTVAKRRMDFCMDNYIGGLLKFYEEVLNAAN